MKQSPSTPPKWLRRAVIFFASLMTPLSVGLLLSLSFSLEVMMQREPEFEPKGAAWSSRPFSPRSNQKFRIGIFADPSGVQTIETLEAYAASARFDSRTIEVRLIAPKLQVIPSTGRLWLWPDLTWDGFEGPLDFLIVPSSLKMESPQTLTLLRKGIARAQNVLFLGQAILGALSAGHIGGEGAHIALPSLTSPDRLASRTLILESKALWARDRRLFTAPGLLTTGAAVSDLLRTLTSAMSAPSESLPHRSVADRTQSANAGSRSLRALRLFWIAGFRWPRSNFEIPLTPGVAEDALARALELPVRSFSARTVTLRESDSAPVVGASGLRLIGVLERGSDTLDPRVWRTLSPSTFAGDPSYALLSLAPVLGSEATRLALENSDLSSDELPSYEIETQWTLILIPFVLFLVGGFGTFGLIRWIQRRERARLKA